MTPEEEVEAWVTKSWYPTRKIARIECRDGRPDVVDLTLSCGHEVHGVSTVPDPTQLAEWPCRRCGQVKA